MIQPTVDGSKIQRPPVDVGSLSSTTIYDGFQEHPRWLLGISQPSTVCQNSNLGFGVRLLRFSICRLIFLEKTVILTTRDASGFLATFEDHQTKYDPICFTCPTYDASVWADMSPKQNTCDCDHGQWKTKSITLILNLEISLALQGNGQ